MTERLQQFNEGNSSKPSPNLFLTSSYSPNGTTLDNPLRFLGSQENHRIFTRKTIDITRLRLLPNGRYFLLVLLTLNHPRPRSPLVRNNALRKKWNARGEREIYYFCLCNRVLSQKKTKFFCVFFMHNSTGFGIMHEKNEFRSSSSPEFTA